MSLVIEFLLGVSIGTIIMLVGIVIANKSMEQ